MDPPANDHDVQVFLSHLTIPERPERIAILANKTERTKYILMQSLGSGCWGEVYVCRNSDEQRFVAKFLELANFSRGNQMRVESEVLCMKKLDHFACLPLIEAFRLPDGAVVLILEYLEKGDLGGHLKQRKSSLTHFSASELEFLICPLLLGLHHIHECKLLHRDITSANVFIAEDNLPKIGDFGESKKYDTLTGAVGHSICGTKEYLAPERLRGEPYGAAADVWSLGVVFYELVELRSPFVSSIEEGDCDTAEHAEQEEARIREAVLVKPLERMTSATASPVLKQIICSMLQKESYNRPTVAHLLKIPTVAAMMERFCNTIRSGNYAHSETILSSVAATLLKVSACGSPLAGTTSAAGDHFPSSSGHPHHSAPVALVESTNEEQPKWYVLTVNGNSFDLQPYCPDHVAPTEYQNIALADCCVFLAADNVFVIRSPTRNYMLLSDAAKVWYAFLNNIVGHVYTLQQDVSAADNS